MSRSPDRALIERCKRGDRKALEELLGRYEKPVYNAAYRILGNPDDAADVAQGAFLKAFEHLDSYKPEYKFFSWIYRIAVNESINHLKRLRDQQPLDENSMAGNGGPEFTAMAGDVSRQVQEGLMSLQEDYRTVIVLRHFSDLSYREIGDVLQIPEKTVKSRLYSARQMMKQKLQSLGVL